MNWRALLRRFLPDRNLRFQEGDLFHAFDRFPQEGYDRLSQILQRGLIAPASDSEKQVIRQCAGISVHGVSHDYERLVFLHQYYPMSDLYLMFDLNWTVILIDRSAPIRQQHEMEQPWMVLCPDEVYVEERLGTQYFKGLVVHSARIDSLLNEFEDTLRNLNLSVYDHTATLRWSP